MIFGLVLVMVFAGWLLAKDETIVKVKVQTANVRSAPDAAAPVIAKVNAGTLLETSGRDGAWYEVTVNNQAGKEVTGYIHNSVVSEVSGEEEAEDEPSRPSAPRYRTAKNWAAGGAKLMGGISMGNMTISEDLGPDVSKTAKMDFMGGVGFESGGQIGIEMDILYSPGGAVIKPTDTTNKAKITLQGAAVTAPIMLKVRFMKGTTPYLLAGGEVGYSLSQKLVADDGAGNVDEEDVSEDTNRLYYGLCFGGGLELQAGSMNLLFEARYRMGLSNLIKDADPGVSIKATAITFLLGIKF
jgi:hypothetical protein